MLCRCRHRGLFACGGGTLVVDEAYGFIERGTLGAKAVRLVRTILIAERDTADDEAIFADGKIVAHELRVRSQRRLRNRCDAKALSREKKGADVGAAIDCTIRSERLVGRNNRDVRRAEKSVVLKHLHCRRGTVAALDADRIVERETAGTPPRQIRTVVL